MEDNFAPNNNARTRWSEPIDWDRVRQSSYEDPRTIGIERRRAWRPFLIAGVAVLGIAVPTAVIVMELFAPVYFARTIQAAQQTLTATSAALSLNEESTKFPVRVTPEIPKPPRRSAGPKKATQKFVAGPSNTGGVWRAALSEPFIIEVIDASGERWFRGKDNKIRVTLKRLPELSKPPEPPTAVAGSVPATQKEPYFMEVHYMDSKQGPKQEVVVLRGTITPSGSLTNLSLLGGPSELGQEAIQIVQSWTLVRESENGQPAASVDARIEVRFDKNDIYVTAEPF